ncbi:MAG: M23 family metallopeptidase [Gammaproteobacteria bacterium]|nr:M23 family metallopeptidase [Gammaproteobacteria bacterium]
MDIIVVNNLRGRSWRVSLQARNVLGWLPLALVAAVFAGAMFAGGWYSRPADGSGLPPGLLRHWGDQLAQQQLQLTATRSQAQADAHALARKLAQLQADMLRVDAAGQRMTQIAGIDSKEFNFDQPAPMGGPETQPVTQPAVMEEVMDSLDRLAAELSNRQRQLEVLEDILLTSRLQREVKPSGWPVTDGYISSVYGERTDPFTGLNSFHPGIDFAAPLGSHVDAVAAGIVTYAGPDAGYGNLVEVNHGNGYVTRYGHNEKILVQVGQRVHRGQPVALIGSTGRSTGPHCHFEVLLNGRTVNPQRYIEASR